MRVLVAYATKHGATKGIAEKIAETLGADGLDVTLAPAKEAGPAANYDGVVVGSAAYMYHWLKEATEYVRDNHAALRDKPVWLFSSGPIGTDLVDAKGRDVYETAKPAEFREFAAAIHPRGERIFFGAYDPDAPPIGLAERIGTFFMKSGVVKEALPAGDFRDWPAIEAWAHEISRELQPRVVPATA